MMPKLAADRERKELDREEVFKRDGYPPLPDSGTEHDHFTSEDVPSALSELADKYEPAVAPDENPRHQEDFTALLNAAAKTKPQGD